VIRRSVEELIANCKEIVETEEEHVDDADPSFL